MFLTKFREQNPFFVISKMAKNQFLNWEKVYKCQKCNFTKKKLNQVFNFTSFFFFFAWTFINFLARYTMNSTHFISGSRPVASLKSNNGQAIFGKKHMVIQYRIQILVREKQTLIGLFQYLIISYFSYKSLLIHSARVYFFPNRQSELFIFPPSYS